MSPLYFPYSFVVERLSCQHPVVRGGDGASKGLRRGGGREVVASTGDNLSWAGGVEGRAVRSRGD